jgi:hypothetical protein
MSIRSPRAGRSLLPFACAATLLLGAAGSVSAQASSVPLANPSLEQASGSTPMSWQLAGYGQNKSSWSHT